MTKRAQQKRPKQAQEKEKKEKVQEKKNIKKWKNRDADIAHYCTWNHLFCPAPALTSPPSPVSRPVQYAM
jgi:hypothetical protein